MTQSGFQFQVRFKKKFFFLRPDLDLKLTLGHSNSIITNLFNMKPNGTGSPVSVEYVDIG